MWRKFNDEKTRAIMELNDFANICGYFYNAVSEKGSSVNNGYNCKHPECHEIQNGVGCCMSCSCPLGWEADEDDCEKFGVEYEDGYVCTDNIEVLKKIFEIEDQLNFQDTCLDVLVNVDWNSNWVKQLEEDIFCALNNYVSETKYNYVHANQLQTKTISKKVGNATVKKRMERVR